MCRNTLGRGARGASSGIGAVFARALAARGYDLALVARREDRLRQLADELRRKFHVNCTLLKADLTSDAELRTVEDFWRARQISRCS